MFTFFIKNCANETIALVNSTHRPPTNMAGLRGVGGVLAGGMVGGVMVEMAPPVDTLGAIGAAGAVVAAAMVVVSTGNTVKPGNNEALLTIADDACIVVVGTVCSGSFCGLSNKFSKLAAEFGIGAPGKPGTVECGML